MSSEYRLYPAFFSPVLMIWSVLLIDSLAHSSNSSPAGVTPIPTAAIFVDNISKIKIIIVIKFLDIFFRLYSFIVRVPLPRRSGFHFVVLNQWLGDMIDDEG